MSLGAFGSDIAFALLAEGRVWAWGDNAFGEQGGATLCRNVCPDPAQVPGLGTVVGLASGGAHSLAVQLPPAG